MAVRDEGEIGLHWDLTQTIIGAYFIVRRELGTGFPEHVYVNAMGVTLRELGLACQREVPYDVVYRGISIGACRADLVVDEKVLVEAKIGTRILSQHRAQAWYYLKASGLKVAVILVFGEQPSTARVEVP